jgi:hypothetical protein
MRRQGTKHDLEVASPAPIWRRSLTESGMRPRATRADRVVVALFLVLLVLMVVGLLLR